MSKEYEEWRSHPRSIVDFHDPSHSPLHILEIGDLVRAPPLAYSGRKAYPGVVTWIGGHKCQILGGPDGTESWDIKDLSLLAKKA